jgi:hypothetical protein
LGLGEECLLVKKRIFNFRVDATHGLITAFGSLDVSFAISDFDAFIFDPSALPHGSVTEVNYVRRQNEIRDLVVGKGGVAICLLRPNSTVGFAVAGRAADTYGLFDLTVPNALAQIRAALRAGWGSHVQVVPSARGASAAYFRELKGVLCFAAYLDTNATNLADVGGTVFAIDSVTHPIAVEFVAGAGRVAFVPVPQGAQPERVGAAIIRVVEAQYGGLGEVEAPDWVVSVGVPGATAHDGRLAELEKEKGGIEAEVSRLRQKRDGLLNYRVLLYGYGRSVLEPVVRSAFRLLGFGVPEPEEYAGEWDVELHEPRSSGTAIGEVEGSTGAVNVDKLRQLLDYVHSEVEQGRDHKGILVGNGYREMAPDAAERQSQFTEKALLGARKFGFCLLPTTELFKAACAVLKSADKEGLKTRIRESILLKVGVWAFACDLAVPSDSAGAAGATTARD